MSVGGLVLVQALHGLVYAMLLFLVASGLTLVYGLMRILNLAHGALYMVGAYLAYTVVSKVGNFWIALIIVPITVGALGLLIERVVLRSSDPAKHSHARELLLTFGVFFVINDLVLWLWGATPLRIAPPESLSGSIPLAGAEYPVYRLFILAISMLVAGGGLLVLAKTRAGFLIRAVVYDPGMALALGIDSNAVRMLGFGFGAGLAGLAGVIAAPLLAADPTMGATVLLSSLVVVVIGGLGSLGGALLASLLIGQLQSFGLMVSPAIAAISELLLLSVVLLFKPTGLFGEAE